MVEEASSFSEIYLAINKQTLTTDFFGHKWIAGSLKLSTVIERVNALFLESGCPPEEREDLRSLSKLIVQWKSARLHPLNYFHDVGKLEDNLLDAAYYPEPEWKNETTIHLDPLINFPKNRLFVTADNFCFLIEDLVMLAKSGKRFVNPYTKLPFSFEDCRQMAERSGNSQIDQYAYALRITSKTLNLLKEAVERYFETYCIDDDHFTPFTFFDPAFERQLSSLDRNERMALDAIYILPWKSFKTDWMIAVGGIEGMTFEELYSDKESLNPSTFIGSLVKLITQIDPCTTFHVQKKDARALINSIKG